MNEPFAEFALLHGHTGRCTIEMQSPTESTVKRVLAPTWVWLAVCCCLSGCAGSDRQRSPLPLTRDARLEKKIAEQVANDPFPSASQIGL